MSHYHLEIIMPPTDNVEGAISSIMEPFDENKEEAYHPFYDWYVIGGRWAGDKFVDSLDQDKLQEFYDWCDNEKLTVSGLIAGKQSLQPATQIPRVDAKWNEMFPREDGQEVSCPLFQHSNNQFATAVLDALDGDVWPLSRSKHATAARVIVAGPSFVPHPPEGVSVYSGPYEAIFMLSQQIWNGVNSEETTWDGTIAKALETLESRLQNYSDEYRQSHTPQDDWLCVTVDYHD
jgi:hypothetical protein